MKELGWGKLPIGPWGGMAGARASGSLMLGKAGHSSLLGAAASQESVTHDDEMSNENNLRQISESGSKAPTG